MSAKLQRHVGQSLVEYAVVMAFIAVVAIGGISYLQGKTNDMFNAQGQVLGAPTWELGSPIAYIAPATATATATPTLGVQPTVALPDVTGTVQSIPGTNVPGRYRSSRRRQRPSLSSRRFPQRRRRRASRQPRRSLRRSLLRRSRRHSRRRASHRPPRERRR